MSESAQEKQHEATPKKLQDLRRKGVVLRSKDLTAGTVLVAAVLTIFLVAGKFFGSLETNFTDAFTQFNHQHDDKFYYIAFTKSVILNNFAMLLPLLGMCFLAAAFSPFLLGGWNFTWDAIRFKFEKMNPFNNIIKMLSPKRAAGEIIRSILKFLVLFLVLCIFIFYKKTFLQHLMDLNIRHAVFTAMFLLKQFVCIQLGALIVLIAGDVMHHRSEFMEQSMMTTQEIKEEYKESEGSGELKGKIRSRQIALSKQRLKLDVPRATVIITNPTHYAIALRYDEKVDSAPKIVAMGKDLMAQQIRFLGTSNGVPIYEAPVLARAIYHTSKVGYEIHPELYMAVAIVLSYVNQLKRYQMGAAQLPLMRSDLDIPAEYIFDE